MLHSVSWYVLAVAFKVVSFYFYALSMFCFAGDTWESPDVRYLCLCVLLLLFLFPMSNATKRNSFIRKFSTCQRSVQLERVKERERKREREGSGSPVGV